MKKRIFSLFAIVGLAMATTLSLSMLTACDDDDDDDYLTETVDDDTDGDSSSDADSSSDDTTDDSSSDADSTFDSDSSITTVGEAIDLGLSVKWADINIGATLPADYGNYYAWGETTTKNSYRAGNSETYDKSGFTDISGTYTDAATRNWGGSWRMPTEAKFNELVDNCTWTWITQEDSDDQTINGYKVEGTSGNSIFLPAAGCYENSSLKYEGKCGKYWSSTALDGSINYFTYALNISSSQILVYNDIARYIGKSVRPVSE